MNNIVTMENQTLGLQAILNARQLGGYKTTDGRTVRRDVLLRTGALGLGTPEDLAKLTDIYHIKTVIDFRTTPEIKASPDPV
ncbi:MAG: tyrosine-protein phosphatase, partial [Clostridia bacterium]|nr:tyrosine-protein phosphatase [Clostridia bacterium]